jgi:coenzyme PQQ precursor peptide PqqA
MEPRTVVTFPIGRYHSLAQYNQKLELEESLMVWTTPTLVEICIGLEINGYLPAEF